MTNGSHRKSRMPWWRRDRTIMAAKTVFVILVVIFVISGFYLLTRLGPKSVEFDRVESVEPDGPPIQGGNSMEKEAELIFKKSLSAEKEADHARMEGEHPKSLELYALALEGQKKINRDYPGTSFRRFERVIALEMARETILVEPDYNLSLKAEKGGRLALSEEEWSKAEKFLEEALDLQEKINREFATSRFTDWARVEHLKNELNSLKSIQGHTRIMAILVEVDELAKEGRNHEAANLLDEAKRLQNLINKVNPESRFASTDRVDELESKRQDILSAESARFLQEKMDRLNVVLGNRNTLEANQIVTDVYRKLLHLKRTYPRNSHFNENDFEKICYLNRKKSDFRLISELVYAHLKPLPSEEMKGILMFETEVPQSLYSQISENNPSRNAGNTFPVESVSWNEAHAFCLRMGWILGKPVSLPTEFHYKSMLSNAFAEYDQISELSWNSSNSDMVIHAIATRSANEFGFYDIQGNVSEWLDSSELGKKELALVGGGSARNSIESMLRFTIERIPRQTRNRFTGFRFVVEDSEGNNR